MAKRKADVLQQKSPAEFFAENKNIAGFDNVSKAILVITAAVRPMAPTSVPISAARQMLVYQYQRASRELFGCSRKHWPASRHCHHHVGITLGG